MATLIGPLTVHETAAALEGAPAPKAFAFAMGSDAFFFDAVVAAGRAALTMRCASLGLEDRVELEASLREVNEVAQQFLGRDNAILRLGLSDGQLAQAAILVEHGKLGLTPIEGGWFLVAADRDATWETSVADPVNGLSEGARIVAEHVTDEAIEGVMWSRGVLTCRPSPAADWQDERAITKRDFVDRLKTWDWSSRSYG